MRWVYMNDKKILIVDDEKAIADILKVNLEKEGFNTIIANDGEEAIKLALSVNPDLILLDLMLPKVDGFTVCKKLRRELVCPIIMLSAKDEVVDKIIGLELGADDYMTKPFAPEELLARVKALTRRRGEVMLDETGYGDFQFNASTSMLSKGTKSVHLNFKEAEILKLLIANRDIILSKEDIITKVWGYDSDAGSNNVEAYVSFLRRKLHFIQSSTEIKAVKKVGYRLEQKS